MQIEAVGGKGFDGAAAVFEVKAVVELDAAEVGEEDGVRSGIAQAEARFSGRAGELHALRTDGEGDAAVFGGLRKVVVDAADFRVITAGHRGDEQRQA